MMMMMNNFGGNIAMKLGVGYRFVPAEEELVFFLYEKLHGRSENLHGYPLMEYDLYGSEEPWQVWNRFGGDQRRKGEDLYLFTKLKKVSSNGRRINRRVGSNGTWSAAYSEDIETHIGCVSVAAHKTHLRYEKQGCPEHGAWIMHEFSLDNNDNDNHEYVLCRLKKKHQNNYKKKMSKEEEEDDDERRQRKKPRIISEFEKEILLKKYLDSLWNQRQEETIVLQVEEAPQQVEEQHKDTNSSETNNNNESNYENINLISLDEILMCGQSDYEYYEILPYDHHHQFNNIEKDKDGIIVVNNNNNNNNSGSTTALLEYKEEEDQEQVLDQIINVGKPSSSSSTGGGDHDGTEEFHENLSSWTVSFAEELNRNYHQALMVADTNDDFNDLLLDFRFHDNIWDINDFDLLAA